MEDVAEQIATEQCFDVEFKNVMAFNTCLSVSGKTDLYRVFVCRSGLPTTDLTGELGSLARLLSVTSTNADIVACSGFPVALIQTINESVFFSEEYRAVFDLKN